MVKKQILGKSGAMEKCLIGVQQELNQFFIDIVNEIVSCYYPKLAVKVENVICDQLSRCSEKCNDHLKELLQEESGYLNPEQADFLISDQLPVHEVIQVGTLSHEKKKYLCVLSWNKLSMYTVPVEETPDIFHEDFDIACSTNIENAFILEKKNDSEDFGTEATYLVAPNVSEFIAWKDAFTNAGVMDEVRLDSETVCIMTVC
jgi:Dynamin central region